MNRPNTKILTLPLKQFWTVDLALQESRYRTYQNSFNPPVLHRKELLIPKENPRYPNFLKLTQAAETLGLFEDTSRIGFHQSWTALLTDKGYRSTGNELIPIGNDESTEFDRRESATRTIERHRTALSRSNFSAPVQMLERFGFLSEPKSLFDYGCGKGDDVRGLCANGIEALGWDPYYSPNQPRRNASIVNLGFVINVIENPIERTEALRNAYQLAQELLVISVMLVNRDTATGKPYGDGVLTGRKTFQKYYTQDEIVSFARQILNVDPIAVAPGVIFVFKDQNEEQRFLSRRRNRRISALSPLQRNHSFQGGEDRKRLSSSQIRYNKNSQLLELLWETWLNLGRPPESDEISYSEEIVAACGSLKKACKILLSVKGGEGGVAIKSAQQSRKEELILYFAKLQFEKRKPYRHLEEGLKRDLKHLFASHKSAVENARDLLFKLANVDEIYRACKEATERGIGWMDAEHSLQLHTSLVDRLPPVLRCYINCGLQLYGDVETADLIKVHIHSGKLTLMEFDDFKNDALPRMVRRIKIHLRIQKIEYYEYGNEFHPPFLYYKSRYINEEFPRFEEQIMVEEKLDTLNLGLNDSYGPPPEKFQAMLEEKRYQLKGLKLERSNTIPSLDSPCGEYLTFRDLIECGETQSQIGIPNRPKRAESYNALYDLAANILDPVIDYFGMVKLTYGFCSSELSNKIPERIAPRIDQHSACELNTQGKLVCNRKGAAADFIVENEDMHEVCRWIRRTLTFDRMYFYGEGKPIHISFNSTKNHNLAYLLYENSHGKKYPKKLR